MILWKKEKFTQKDCISHSCAIHILLIHNSTNKSIWLSNLHLKAGLNNAENTRLTEIKSCIERIMTKLVNKEDIILIMCGDFNDNFTHHWENKEKDQCKIYKELMQNNYFIHEVPISTCVNRKYWWAFNRLCTKGLDNNNIKIKYDLEEEYDFSSSISIPNFNIPSDHLPLVFVLKL